MADESGIPPRDESRRYCGMFGVCTEARPDGLCPECCQPHAEHRSAVPQGWCGNWAQLPDGDGSFCAQPIGHEGRCVSYQNKVAEVERVLLTDEEDEP